MDQTATRLKIHDTTKRMVDLHFTWTRVRNSNVDMHNNVSLFVLDDKNSGVDMPAFLDQGKKETNKRCR